MDMYGGSLSTSPDCFRIDDLVNLSSNHQPTTTHHLTPPCSDHHPDHFFTHFPSLHSDEAAELEWLSQFVDDTTSFHDFPQNHTVPSHTTSFPDDDHNNNSNSNSNNKKSSHSHHAPSSSSSGSGKSRSKRELNGGEDGVVRRCSHCASEKTPQWRTGPLGPKTLCNACGVRFKSGRLVPEYRPAASPTFVLTQHSNSHRKVMELRRQKELLRQQQHDFKVC